MFIYDSTNFELNITCCWLQESMNAELDNLLEHQSALENKMSGLHKIL